VTVDDRAALEVLEPGLLTTVQDAGRPDWTHLGVPVGGACDPWSLAVANLLAGADAGAAALEMTITGPTLAVRTATTIGLAGADLGGVVRETGRRLPPGPGPRGGGGHDDCVSRQ
jgi:allophanate hydrolase subunit 2